LITHTIFGEQYRSPFGAGFFSSSNFSTPCI
jgi:hypothetical protein